MDLGKVCPEYVVEREEHTGKKVVYGFKHKVHDSAFFFILVFFVGPVVAHEFVNGPEDLDLFEEAASSAGEA